MRRPTSSDAGSLSESDDGAYETPTTSPECSPYKTTCLLPRQKCRQHEVPQIDGGTSEEDEPSGRLDRWSRQRHLMAMSVHSPDRFIPSRAATPTKETLLMPKPGSRASASTVRTFSRGRLADPFSSRPRRTIGMAEEDATLRHPLPLQRPVGLAGSRAQDIQSPTPRAASTGTVWTVGGTVVTEGVASTTNGRGGRVTSGTSAPHYTADFLRKNAPTEDEVMHGRRLAVAMDINQQRRMVDQRPQLATNSAGTRVWRDGRWEVNGEVSSAQPERKKVKDMPIIPFRVLDAPALRDDYYCSLLAYSPSVDCLAVSLGPHVYLWTKSRGTTNIPDSLTAPVGTAHVTSVSFSSSEGGSAILAIGRASGRITLWSPLDSEPRFDSEQPAPVSCVCFRPNSVQKPSLRDSIVMVQTEELLVGDELGSVHYYSVEWPNADQRDLFDWHGSMTLLAKISCHAQQICGLTWSLNGACFATGGNDNQLFLFESKKILRRPVASHIDPTSQTSVHVRNAGTFSNDASDLDRAEVLSITPGQQRSLFTLNAAVKALAFAPWQPSLLAAGGGSNDRCIHFFHILSGAVLATIDCYAQVTSLVWSSRKKEIAATFGFAQPEHPYRVAVFAWPSCHMVVGIPWWGEERALFAVPYPRGPSSGHPHRRQRVEDEGGAHSEAQTEGQAWYGRRTREEGCLVVATSDASIKFHEIWAESHGGGKRGAANGSLGGSPILEGSFENAAAIR